MAPTDVESTAPGLMLQPAEQAILLEDVPAFARTLRDPASQARYAALVEAVRRAQSHRTCCRPSKRCWSSALQTKAIRHRHGPDIERAMTDLYFRTERGSAQRQAARDVTRALEALAGQTIERLSVSTTPGRHTITVNTDRAHLTLSVDRSGVQVDRVEVGG